MPLEINNETPAKSQFVWPEYRHKKPLTWSKAADRPVLFIERAAMALGVSVYDLKNDSSYLMASYRRAFCHVAHDSLGWPIHQVKTMLGLKCGSGVCRSIKRSRIDAIKNPDYANVVDALEAVT